MSNSPRINVPVGEVHVFPGQSITVWLHDGFMGDKHNQAQVELRVVAGLCGKAEVYVSDTGASVKVEQGFQDWYSIDGKEG